MNISKTPAFALLFIIAVCLLKITFFPNNNASIVPAVSAESGPTEISKNTEKMITSGENGSVTYVWDYTGKTQVRKYYIEGGKLKLKVFDMEN